MGRRRLASILAASALAAAGIALAHPIRIHERFDSPPAFVLAGAPIGGASPARATAAFLAGSRIAAVGAGALVIDADSGQLVLAGADGTSLAQLAIGRDAGLLAYDPAARRAYVADRAGDRVAIVGVTDDKLALVGTLATPAEPYGIALTPDRATVLVTTIADRTLVAYDAKSHAERWRVALDRDPLAIAVSPDGARALVTYLATGTVDQVGLGGTHAVQHILLAPGSVRRSVSVPAFPRAPYAVAFMGDHQAVLPFQRETPVQIATTESTNGYGGGGEPPITHHLAFIGFDGKAPDQVTAEISLHQPRALAWDGAADALYIAGLGNDVITRLDQASRRTVKYGYSEYVSAGTEACGADGLAIASDGNLLVWCSFARKIERIDVKTRKIAPGPAIAASSLDDAAHRGMVLFHTRNAGISRDGTLACSSCHPDGRADGLSWSIDTHLLQTPVLAGRVVGTHPYKWDGGDPDLHASIATTMKRLGGFGLDDASSAALAKYIEQMPRPRTPTRDAGAVARGQKLFDANGCRSCHEGAALTDQQHHEFAGSTLPLADTPSLVGLAESAPYYHDGSAESLQALLRGRGSVHGMADTSKLGDREIADLTAFLETL